MATEFSGKSTTGLERPSDTSKHRIRVALHPVESGVRKRSIELGLEGKMKSIGKPGINSVLLCGRHHIRRAIHANHCSPGFADQGGKHAVAAAHIQDAFARLRIQQVKDGPAEQGDERCVLSIAISFPHLRHFAAGVLFRSRL